MAAQLHIIVRDMAHPQGFDAKARNMLASLERICPRITSIHMTLEESGHRHAGPRFCVKLDVRLPGLEVVVSRDHDEDVHVALREACQAARRQLLENLSRRRGTGKVGRAKQRGRAIRTGTGGQ